MISSDNILQLNRSIIFKRFMDLALGPQKSKFSDGLNPT